MSTDPQHGYTEDGTPVHGKVVDHHATDTAYARFNKKAMLLLTNKTGTATTFWVFCLISLLCLPSVLVLAHVIPVTAVGILGAMAFQLIVSWFAQTFVQFVLLPGIMVGQNIQNEAADARAAKQFEYAKATADALDLSTQGGLKDVLDEVKKISEKLSEDSSS
jgi:hypothetical protein